MDFVQLQVNYLDWEDPVVESEQMPWKLRKNTVCHVVIMESQARGGALADLPEQRRKRAESSQPRQERGFVGLSILLQPAQRYQRALGGIDVGADSGKRARMEGERAL